MLIDTPLLVVGRGPAALVVAKVAGRLRAAVPARRPRAARRRRAGRRSTPTRSPRSHQHGVLDVLRPYLAAVDPPSIAPRAFEEVLKHHCVADLNVTVYDDIEVVERAPAAHGLPGVLTDGTSRWDVSADTFVDAADLPTTLPDAITAAARRAAEVMAISKAPGSR